MFFNRVFGKCQILLIIVGAAIISTLPEVGKGEENEKELAHIEVVELAGTGTAGTFQSHNQKVVHNNQGIFLTYEYQKDPVIWRLMRSTDNGKSFKTVYESRVQTAPPAMETDERGYIYLTHPDWEKKTTHFLRFTSENGYTAPDIQQIYPDVTSGAKFAMAYDKKRRRLYHATQFGYILTIDMSGKLLRNQHVWSGTSTSGTAYPHLFLDAEGILHHAVTMHDGYNYAPYKTIQYITSPDGGTSWQAMDGTVIKLPVTTASDGPSTTITLDDETLYATWLANMHVKQGKLHFYYATHNPWRPEELGNPAKIESRYHYMRFDQQTGVREIDSWADWKNSWQGGRISLQLTSAVFVSGPQAPSGPLYAVSRNANNNRLAALISFDNGSTWQDYAESRRDFAGIYAVGGFREGTSDHKIIGSFSGQLESGGPWKTFYFQFTSHPDEG